MIDRTSNISFYASVLLGVGSKLAQETSHCVLLSGRMEVKK